MLFQIKLDEYTIYYTYIKESYQWPGHNASIVLSVQ